MSFWGLLVHKPPPLLPYVSLQAPSHPGCFFRTRKSFSHLFLFSLPPKGSHSIFQFPPNELFFHPWSGSTLFLLTVRSVKSWMGWLWLSFTLYTNMWLRLRLYVCVPEGDLWSTWENGDPLSSQVLGTETWSTRWGGDLFTSRSVDRHKHLDSSFHLEPPASSLS